MDRRTSRIVAIGGLVVILIVIAVAFALNAH
jgi:CHASE3 domain sensor protein